MGFQVLDVFVAFEGSPVLCLFESKEKSVKSRVENKFQIPPPSMSNPIMRK
jgi:hypothetical protein